MRHRARRGTDSSYWEGLVPKLAKIPIRKHHHGKSGTRFRASRPVSRTWVPTQEVMLVSHSPCRRSRYLFRAQESALGAGGRGARRANWIPSSPGSCGLTIRYERHASHFDRRRDRCAFRWSARKTPIALGSDTVSAALLFAAPAVLGAAVLAILPRRGQARQQTVDLAASRPRRVATAVRSAVGLSAKDDLSVSNDQ